MDIHHPEEAIKGMRDGHKFVTYKDAWVEHVDDILCPFCGRSMTFHVDSVTVGQGVCASYFNLECGDCSFKFHGLNDYHEFQNQNDFLLFCRDKIDSLKQRDTDEIRGSQEKI